MSWEEMEDLLNSMEMILSFRWDVADVSKTTLAILISKINSLLKEIFKASVCQENTFMNEYYPTPLLLIIYGAIKNLYIKVT